MIILMVFVTIGILGIPYMWLIFTDDHHSIAYGATAAADTAPEPEAAAASTAAAAVSEPKARARAEETTEEMPSGGGEATATATVAEAAVTAAPTDDAPTEPEATAAPAEEKPAVTSEPAAEAPPAKEDAEKPTKSEPEKDEPPPRVLPSDDEISAWANGADVASIGTLFEGLLLKRFDAFNAQFRNKEILAQHWQVISELETPDDEVFDGLPEVGYLRQQYRDQELARRRLGAMKVAWRELRGKSPGLWQVPDLMAAIRRIIDKQIEVDFNDLLHAARDLWRGMTLPVGKEQVEILWACIALVRKGTKK